MTYSTAYEYLTARAAQSIGLTGSFDETTLFVLDEAARPKWGSTSFDPVDNNGDAFTLAGMLGFRVAFEPSRAVVQPHGFASHLVAEFYEHNNADRFKAARLAVVRCAISLDSPKG